MWPASHRQCRSTRCASCLASEWCGARQPSTGCPADVSVVNAAGSGFVVGLNTAVGSIQHSAAQHSSTHEGAEWALFNQGVTDLRFSLLCRYGEITQVHIVRDANTQLCKGFCFISFANKEQAAEALHGE